MPAPIFFRRAIAVCVALTALVAASGPTATEVAAQTQADGRTLRIPFPTDDGSLTPYTFDTGYALLTLVYDTILWRDTEGTPRPWLARSVDTSGDGRRVTVRLMEGVKWHDGAPLTAEDIAFTFRFFAERPRPRFTPELSEVERVDVVNPTTAVIVLRRASPGFMDQPLADLPILPARVWGALPAGKAVPDGLAMGSGPYRLVNYQPGRGYTFEANRAYFRGRPAIDRIEVPIVESGDETLSALVRGSVDIIPGSIPPQRLDDVTGSRTRTVTGVSYLGTVLMFNVRRPPFDQATTRRAVAQALDLAVISQAAGDAVPADRGYLHPESPWASTTALHSFEPAAARSALGRTSVPAVDLLVPDDDPQRRAAGEQVALELRQVGLDVRLRELPPEDLSKAVGQNGSAPSFQMAIWRSPPLASFDPDFVRRVFGSRPQDGSLNYSGYASGAFDAAATRVATTIDPVARRTAVAEQLRVLAGDDPVVPLYFSRGSYAIRPAAFDGWVYVKGSGILDKRSFVEPAPAPPPAPAEQRQKATPATTPPEGEGGSLPLGWIAVGLVLVAGALIALGFRRSS